MNKLNMPMFDIPGAVYMSMDACDPVISKKTKHLGSACICLHSCSGHASLSPQAGAYIIGLCGQLCLGTWFIQL